MALTFIDYDRNTEIGRRISRSLQMIREGRDVLRDVLKMLPTMIDGDGKDAAHFPLVKTKGGFADTASAKASWEELNSLYAKLVSSGDDVAKDVGPAIDQCCAKHGV